MVSVLLGVLHFGNVHTIQVLLGHFLLCEPAIIFHLFLQSGRVQKKNGAPMKAYGVVLTEPLPTSRGQCSVEYRNNTLRYRATEKSPISHEVALDMFFSTPLGMKDDRLAPTADAIHEAAVAPVLKALWDGEDVSVFLHGATTLRLLLGRDVNSAAPHSLHDRGLLHCIVKAVLDEAKARTVPDLYGVAVCASAVAIDSEDNVPAMAAAGRAPYHDCTFTCSANNFPVVSLSTLLDTEKAMEILKAYTVGTGKHTSMTSVTFASSAVARRDSTASTVCESPGTVSAAASAVGGPVWCGNLQLLEQPRNSAIWCFRRVRHVLLTHTQRTMSETCGSDFVDAVSDALQEVQLSARRDSCGGATPSPPSSPRRQQQRFLAALPALLVTIHVVQKCEFAPTKLSTVRILAVPNEPSDFAEAVSSISRQLAQLSTRIPKNLHHPISRLAFASHLARHEQHKSHSIFVECFEGNWSRSSLDLIARAKNVAVSTVIDDAASDVANVASNFLGDKSVWEQEVGKLQDELLVLTKHLKDQAHEISELRDAASTRNSVALLAAKRKREASAASELRFVDRQVESGSEGEEDHPSDGSPMADQAAAEEEAQREAQQKQQISEMRELAKEADLQWCEASSTALRLRKQIRELTLAMQHSAYSYSAALSNQDSVAQRELDMLTEVDKKVEGYEALDSAALDQMQKAMGSKKRNSVRKSVSVCPPPSPTPTRLRAHNTVQQERCRQIEEAVEEERRRVVELEGALGTARLIQEESIARYNTWMGLLLEYVLSCARVQAAYSTVQSLRVAAGSRLQMPPATFDIPSFALKALSELDWAGYSGPTMAPTQYLEHLPDFPLSFCKYDQPLAPSR